MKKRTILQNMEKLDSLPLPEKEKILSACDAALLESAPTKAAAKHKQCRFSPKRAVALAVAALLLIGGGVTVVAAEAVEYKRAADFFEEYNLSAEGLSRSEIKKVYRDITARRFTYGKTAEVLTDGLEGYEIQSAPLTADDLKRLWLSAYSDPSSKRNAEDDRITYSFVHKMDSDQSVLYDDEIAVLENGKWKRSFKVKGIYLDVLCKVGKDRLLLVGTQMEQGAVKQNAPLIARIIDPSHPADTIWEVTVGKGSIETATAAYSDGGRTCVVTDGYLKETRFFCITEFSQNGRITKKLEIPADANGKVLQIIPWEDSYLLRRVTYSTTASQDDSYRILRVHPDGTVSDAMLYGSDGERYEITDMQLYNGRLYLSGKMISDAIGGMFTYRESFERHNGTAATCDEDCLTFVRENHTAVLLICNPNGTPQEYYSIPGATGGDLEVNNGNLCWTAGRYVSAELCDEASIYLTSVTAAVTKYSFNAYGQLVGETTQGYEYIEY